MSTRPKLALWPGRHTPVPHRQLLKRLGQKALEECADASQRANHVASIEKFLGIEDDLAGAGASGSPAIRDKRQACDLVRQCAWPDHLAEQRSLVGTHHSCRAEPDQIDRTRPSRGCR
jgi:hypothetical protein